MDITKLREQTAAARASKEKIEDAEFSTSLFRKYFDALIKEAAANGEGKISTNFYCAKEHIFCERYCSPAIEAAIRHYSREGFYVRKENCLSPNGYGNTNLIISWM